MLFFIVDFAGFSEIFAAINITITESSPIARSSPPKPATESADSLVKEIIQLQIICIMYEAQVQNEKARLNRF